MTSYSDTLATQGVLLIVIAVILGAVGLAEAGICFLILGGLLLLPTLLTK